MRRYGAWLIGLLVVVGAVAVGNVPPTMDDQYVTTVEDTLVRFELRAQDEDIDPNDPDAHPLRFVLVDGPNHGILIGDMSKIHYEGPHDAVIEMTYVPAAGFVGIDRVVIAVVDPFDETASGTVTIQIDVAKRRARGLLSGNWSMNATWESQSGSPSVFSTQLTEAYRVGALTIKGVAQARKALIGGVERIVFDALRFDGDIKLGGLAIASTVAFDPDAPSAGELFDSWRTTVGFALREVSFRYTLYLATPVTSSYQTLVAQASTGGLSFTNTLRFGAEDGCGFEFSRNDTSVGWSWCDLNLSATFAVSCDGFQQATFSQSGLPIPLLVSGLTLDAKLTFTEEAKALSTTLQWQPTTSGCIRLYTQLNTGGTRGMEVEGFTVYGIRMDCEIGDVNVVSATSLDPARNATMTGQTDYFEVLRMSGTLKGCCELSGTWGLATYFYTGSTQLFDWGMLTGTFDLVLTDDVSVNLETVLRSGELGGPEAELSVGWTVRW